MNWYKKANNEIKAAWNWPIFLKTLGITIGAALIPMIAALGLEQGDVIDLFQKSNNNEIQLKDNLEAMLYSDLAAAPEPTLEYDFDGKVYPENRDFNYNDFRSRLIGLEGLEYRSYDVGSRGERDIGSGHAMYNPNDEDPTAVSRQIFEKLFGDTVDFDTVLAGKQDLTRNQVIMLTHYDIDRHLDRARRVFPKFNTYPSYLQEALLDSVYRGDTGWETTKLINSGNWSAAADEYINREDYRNAVKDNMSGIRGRMDNNRDMMLRYAKEVGQ